MLHQDIGSVEQIEIVPHSIALRELDGAEIEDVSGGFVCGGLCIAGAAFGAGALFGSGVVVGWYSAKRNP